MSSVPSRTPSQLVPPCVVETDMEEAQMLPIPFPKRAGAPVCPGAQLCPLCCPFLGTLRSDATTSPQSKACRQEPLQDTAIESKEKGRDASGTRFHTQTSAKATFTFAYLAFGCRLSVTALNHSSSFGVSSKRKASLLRSSSWKLC